MRIGSPRNPSRRGDETAVETIPLAPQITQRRPGMVSTLSRSFSRMVFACFDSLITSKLSIRHTTPPRSGVGNTCFNQSVINFSNPLVSNALDSFGALSLPNENQSAMLKLVPPTSASFSSFFRVPLKSEYRLISGIQSAARIKLCATERSTSNLNSSGPLSISS